MNWLKENWFKVGLLIVGVIFAYVIYQSFIVAPREKFQQQRQDELAQESSLKICLAEAELTANNDKKDFLDLSKQYVLNISELDKIEKKLTEEKNECFKLYK